MDRSGAVAATASKECRLDHIVDDAIDARIDGPMKTRANCEQAQPAWVPIARSAPSLTAAATLSQVDVLHVVLVVDVFCDLADPALVIRASDGALRGETEATNFRTPYSFSAQHIAPVTASSA